MLILLALTACSGHDTDTGDAPPTSGEMSLVTLTPESDAVGVPLDADIVAEFDRELRFGDVSVDGLRSVSGIDGNTITARLSEPMDLLTTYTLGTFNVVGTDDSVFDNLQSTFTSRDGVWQGAEPVLGQTDLIAFDAAASRDAVLLLTAREGRTEVLSIGLSAQSEPTVLDDGDAPANPMLATQQDEAVAVWTQDGDLFAASATTGTWSTPTQVSTASGVEQTPTGLAITEEGTAAVGWRSSSARIRVATQVDGTWSEPVNIGCDAQSECTSVHLVADHTEDLRALVLGLTAAGQQIETSRFVNGEWSTASLLFSVDGNLSEPVLRANADATLAMWRVTGGEDAGLYMSRLSDDGQWGDIIEARNSDTLTAFDVVARHDGGFTASWIEEDANNTEQPFGLWVSGVEETALTDPFRLVESDAPLPSVNLASDAGGNLHLTWTEDSAFLRLNTRRFDHTSGWNDRVLVTESALTTPSVDVVPLPGNRQRAVFSQASGLTSARFE